MGTKRGWWCPHMQGQGAAHFLGEGGFTVRRSRWALRKRLPGAPSPQTAWRGLVGRPVSPRRTRSRGVRGWRALSRPCGALRRPSLESPRWAARSWRPQAPGNVEGPEEDDPPSPRRDRPYFGPSAAHTGERPGQPHRQLHMPPPLSKRVFPVPFLLLFPSPVPAFAKPHRPVND